MLSFAALALFVAPEIRLTGDWTVAVGDTALAIAKPTLVVVTKERYDAFPDFDPKAAPWRRGARLVGVVAEECTVQGALDPASLIVQSESAVLEKGKDYDADLAAGTAGRLPNGTLAAGQTVWISYRYAKQRIDSIVRLSTGRFAVRQGEAHAVTPVMPALEAGEERVANVHISGRMERLTESHLFPILESAFPATSRPDPAPVRRALGKLQRGEPLRILAWGDSVTTYNRYQSMFVKGLEERFPNARIELITEAWGGRNTGNYLKEPAGSPHNYEEKVLGAKPDLVISEFVNDAGLNEAQVAERYGKLWADFQRIGAEWIILAPHYVRPDWMGLTRQRDIDDDPRAYVRGIRQFAAAQRVGLADASARYGRLWRQGIPYLTLMENNINHPNLYGHRIFAESLLALFPNQP